MTKIFALCCAITMAFVPVAQAQDLVFILQNETSVDLMEFYISPTDVDDWEEDLLGSNYLAAGYEISVTIADGRTTCIYDILGVFRDGDSVEDYGIDICTMGGYAFYE